MNLWRKITLGGLLEGMARVGYAARGFVYVSIGLIALLAAFEWTDRASGGKGAMAVLAGWPLGYAWLMAVGFGLLGFAGWRTLQAVFDADRQGHETAALLTRIGQGVSALVYGGLAFSIFELLDEVEDLAEADEREEHEARQSAAEVLSWPYGQWLLIAAGLFIIGVALANLLKGFTGKGLGERLGCGPITRRWACRVGRAGYFGRGVALIPVGAFLFKAGLAIEPGAARTLGGALQALERRPFGSELLALTATGLIAFGLFSLFEARFRCIDVPDDVVE